MATALVAGLVACTRNDPPDADSLKADLVAVVGQRRYIEARVPGGFRYGPLMSPRRSGTPASDPPSILAVLAKAEALPTRHTPDGLLLRGIARLLSGRVEQSISLLSLATTAHPSADAWAALSAAYLEAAQAKSHLATELTARALDAAEQALTLDSRSREAWFNRALAAGRLGPCEPAQTAWDEYGSGETDAEWRSEGDRYKSALGLRCRQVQAFDTVPGYMRARIEETLLPAWGSAWTAARYGEADTLLGEAQRLAAAVRRGTGDAYAVDLVEEITQADPDARRRLAAAWEPYGRSRDLLNRSRDAEAARAVRAAERSGISRVGSLRLLVELQMATMGERQRQVGVASTVVEHLLGAAEARGYPVLVARARIVRGLVRVQQGRLSDGAREYRQAGDVLERLEEPEVAAAAFSGLANTMRQLNDLRGTWSALARTLGVIDRVQQLRRRYVALYGAFLVAQSAGLNWTALWFQSAALDMAERRGIAGAIVEAYTSRAELRERLRPGSGAEDLAIARKHLPEVSDPGRVRYYSALIDAIEGDSLLERDPTAARERYGRALDFFATYDIVEIPRLYLGRGRASRRIGDVAGARNDFLAGAGAFEEGRLKIDVENRVAYFDAAHELYDELVALSAEDPHAAFAFAERGRALTVLEALGGPVETSIERLAAQLPADTALVRYITLPERLMVWVVTPTAMNAAVVPEPLARLERRVLSFLAAIADEEGADDVDNAAEALYKVLLRPVARHLDSARHLVIVGDGPIHQVPFALLRAEGRYLVERFAIVNALSASAFLAAERNRSGAGLAPQALVVGNPAYDRELYDGLRPLPSAEREAAGIAGMYPRRTLLTREAATRARFLQAAATSSIIHFGGHAVIDGEAPDRSALLLATDERHGSTLTAPEIARLRLTGMPVVVLAACSTATGAAYRLEGATSLSRAFLLAGAASVVGTLWDIEDNASEAFFISFHQRLAAGDAPAAALRWAQLELLSASDARLRAPQAWAAFQLIGALSRPSA